MSESTRCTIISLDIRLNSMLDWAHLTRSLMARMKHSILGSCSFLCARFRFIPRMVISLHSGSNSLSVCICVILKSRYSYNLCTCVIPSTLFSVLRFLVILPVANIMCRYIVLRKPIPLVCMSNMMCHYIELRKPIPLVCIKSKQMVNSLYLSGMVLGTLVI